MPWRTSSTLSAARTALRGTWRNRRGYAEPPAPPGVEEVRAGYSVGAEAVRGRVCAERSIAAVWRDKWVQCRN